MLIIRPTDPREEPRNRLSAQQERVRELSRKRLLWNILIAAVPIGIWLTGIFVRMGLNPDSFASDAVGLSALILQFSALGITILVHGRYAKKLEQARTELLELTVEQSRISLEESRENDAA